MKTLVPTLALLCLAPAAFAQTDLGVAGKFNAVIFGDATTINGGEAEGSIAIGGNWTAGTYNVNTTNLAPTVGSASKISAYVRGNVSSTGSTQIKYGNAYVGGTLSGSALLYDSGYSKQNAITSVSTSIFSQATYQNQSNYLASLTDQAVNVADPNNLSIDLNTATKYGNMKVFSIAASALGANRILSITNFSSAYTLLINITGGDVGHFGLTVNGGNYNRILWNNNSATSITIDNRQFEGSLLAPNASVIQKNVIEGNLIAAMWSSTTGNELHFGAGKQFDGTLLSASTKATPEPGTLALLVGSGTAGFVFLRRRKRSAR